VHATAVTASQSMPAGQLSVRTKSSCYNCCAHSRVHSTFRTCFYNSGLWACGQSPNLFDTAFPLPLLAPVVPFSFCPTPFPFENHFFPLSLDADRRSEERRKLRSGSGQRAAAKCRFRPILAPLPVKNQSVKERQECLRSLVSRLMKTVN